MGSKGPHRLESVVSDQGPHWDLALLCSAVLRPQGPSPTFLLSSFLPQDLCTRCSFRKTFPELLPALLQVSEVTPEAFQEESANVPAPLP